MSFLKQQKGLYVLIYTNPAELARESGIVAVVRICFGSDQDSIAIPYARLGPDATGYQMPAVVVVTDGVVGKLPLITGNLWLDLVALAGLAMQRVKAKYKLVPQGKLYKVYRGAENKTIVEEQAAT